MVKILTKNITQEQLEKIRNELDEMEGWRVKKLLKFLTSSIFILKTNYNKLIEGIKLFKKTIIIVNDGKGFGVRLWNGVRDHVSDFQNEFISLIHNYLASVKSLIGHTRVFLKKLNNSKLSSLWQAKFKQLERDEKIHFIQKLRDYTQHYMLPIIAFGLKVKDNGEISKYILLSNDELKKWSGWKGSSKKFVEKGLDINIRELIDNYQTEILRIYDNLIKNIEDFYSKDINEYEEKYKEKLNDKMVEYKI